MGSWQSETGNGNENENDANKANENEREGKTAVIKHYLLPITVVILSHLHFREMISRLLRSRPTF